MPTVDYLPVANGGSANVETQAQYVLDLTPPSGSLANGYQTGVAKSNQFNKSIRQCSMVAAAIANFISNALNINVLDDGNLSVLVTNFTNAIKSVVPGAGYGNKIDGSGNLAMAAVGAAAVHGLVIKNDAVTPNTKIDISLLDVTLINSNGQSKYFGGGQTLTLDLTTGNVSPTLNGMDGEARPTSALLYLYAISDGTTLAGIASTVPLPVGPTLTGLIGYAFVKYLGFIPCDGSANLMRTQQNNNKLKFTVRSATNTAALPVLASGAAGNINTPTWVAVAVPTALVPASASELAIVTFIDGTSAQILVAPNGNFGGLGSTTNPPPVRQFSAGGAGEGSTPFDMIIESTNIYWANTGEAGNMLQLWGVTDTYV